MIEKDGSYDKVHFDYKAKYIQVEQDQVDDHEVIKKELSGLDDLKVTDPIEEEEEPQGSRSSTRQAETSTELKFITSTQVRC